MYRDPDGTAALSVDLHDQFKYKALDLIEDTITATFKVNVKGVQINSCDGTPRKHKEELLRLLKRLRIANCFHVKYIKWDATKGITQKLFSV